MAATALNTATTDHDNEPSFSSYQERQIPLATGVSMKVTLDTSAAADKDNNDDKPVLLFLHGSFHGGWCWTEYFFPYFVRKGYRVVAPCWRGTGGTFAGEGVKKVQIQQHVADLESLLDQLPSLLGPSNTTTTTTTTQIIKPIVIAHSFGSLAVMKLLELHPERTQQLWGIVMMCAVPPSGNGRIIGRYLRKFWWRRSFKITRGFAMKQLLTDAPLCRELFFGGPKTTTTTTTIPNSKEEDPSAQEEQVVVVDDHGVSDQDIARYQEYFTRDSKATIDLLDLAKQLPSATTAENGQAPFVARLPPCMVLGATGDVIVDHEGVEETARYFNVDAARFVDAPHDVMLTNQWHHAAQELDTWLDSLSK